MIMGWGLGRMSEVAAQLLLPLDRLEERLEVTHAEAQGTVPLDELVEHRWPVTDRLGEDLQEVTVLVAVVEDAPLLQLLHRDADLADAGPQLRIVVVRVRRIEELHPFGTHEVNGAQDVIRGKRDVLTSWLPVELEVLIDLRLLLAKCGLVQRELH